MWQRKLSRKFRNNSMLLIKNTPAVNGTKLPDATGANISINDILSISTL